MAGGKIIEHKEKGLYSVEIIKDEERIKKRKEGLLSRQKGALAEQEKLSDKLNDLYLKLERINKEIELININIEGALDLLSQKSKERKLMMIDVIRSTDKKREWDIKVKSLEMALQLIDERDLVREVVDAQSVEFYEYINVLLEEGGEILVFTTNILKCLKQFEDMEIKHKALKLIEKILQNKHLLKLCDYKVIDLTPVEYLLAYILFYFYNPIHKNFIIKLDLNNLFGKEIGAKTMLMDILIEFTQNKNYGIEIQEIELFKLILGDVFYKELINLIDQRLINKNIFDTQHFEMLLSR